MGSQIAKQQNTWVRLCLISAPGPICDATCATLAHTARVKLVAIASGALSATKVVQQVQPDLVLLDANIPEEESFALVQWLTDNCPHVPSLVATLSSAQLHQALAFGASAAVRRDELPSKLVMLVDELLGASDQWTEA